METFSIAQTDHTYNMWEGFFRVSPCCKNCYAETIVATRYHRVIWALDGTRRRLSMADWRRPQAWNRDAASQGVRPKVFCASLADVFEDQPSLAPWREVLNLLVRVTPNLDWLLVTNRPENIRSMIPAAGLPSNVWLGTTAENEEMARIRIPELLKIPAMKHFLIVEPLLGPLAGVDLTGLDGVIVGGESGAGARPMELDWVRDIRDQCVAKGIAFFFKQLAGNHPEKEPLLDGIKWTEFPA